MLWGHKRHKYFSNLYWISIMNFACCQEYFSFGTNIYKIKTYVICRLRKSACFCTDVGALCWGGTCGCVVLCYFHNNTTKWIYLVCTVSCISIKWKSCKGEARQQLCGQLSFLSIVCFEMNIFYYYYYRSGCWIRT